MLVTSPHHLSGKLIKKGFGLNELLNIHNSAKGGGVKEPEAGIWTVKVLLCYRVCCCFILMLAWFFLACFIKYIYNSLFISSLMIMEKAFC